MEEKITIDNALYEAIIMSPMPMSEIPICDECLQNGKNYQKNFRGVWSKRWKEETGLRTLFDQVNNVVTNKIISGKESPERYVRVVLNVLRENLNVLRENDDLEKNYKEKLDKLRDDLEKNYKEKFDKFRKHPLPNGDRKCLVCCNKEIQNEKIYSLSPLTARRELCDLYHELTQTFEVQRLKHLLMTGVFPIVRSSLTHTRFSHCEGTWILGWYALTDIKVDGKPLIDFLAEWDLHREFMASLILHDIGHAPFSHVIEQNPYIEYDHENIAKDMIMGGDKYHTLKDILAESIYYNRDTLYKQFGISIENIEDWMHEYRKGYILVHDVIGALGLDPYEIVEFFHDDGKKTKDPAIKMLRVLVSGVMDLDRVDHIYRDIHFTSYARSQPSVRAMFNGFNFYYGDGEDPLLDISKDIVSNIKSLFETREVTHRIYKENIENNFYIGLLNMAIADAVRINPVLEDLIPFISDESLLYFLTDRDQFDYPRAMEKIRLFHASKNIYEKYIGIIYQVYKNENNKQLYKFNKIEKREFARQLFELFESEKGYEKDVFSTTLLGYSDKEYSGDFKGINIIVGGGKKSKESNNKFDKKYSTYLKGLDKTVERERSSLLYVYFYKDSDYKKRINDFKKKIESKGGIRCIMRI